MVGPYDCHGCVLNLETVVQDNKIYHTRNGSVVMACVATEGGRYDVILKKKR